MSTEALARALLDYRRTVTDTDQVKAIDLHQAQQMLRDPGPLLAALAEAGVLTEEWGIPDGLAGLQKRTFHSQGMAEALSNDRPVTRRYVTDWTEVQP